MGNVEDKFSSYRERMCTIKNKNIEIENLKLCGSEENGIEIKEIQIEISKLQLENKKIDNILKLLSDKEYRVIKGVFIEGDGKDKKKVAKCMDRTERHINRILNKGIKKIGKHL